MHSFPNRPFLVSQNLFVRSVYAGVQLGEAIIFLGLGIMFFRQNFLLSQEKLLENTTFHCCLASLLKIRFDTFACRYAREYWRTGLLPSQRTAGRLSWVVPRVNKTNKSSSKFAGQEQFTVKVRS